MNVKLSILNTISIILSAVAIILFFIKIDHYEIIMYICAGITLLYSILNVILGDQNNLNTEIFTIFIGFVVASYFKLSTLPIIAFAICAGEIAITILSLIVMLVFLLNNSLIQLLE